MITLEEIYQGLASEFQAQTGQTAGGSSELAVRFYAVAAQIYSLYVQAEWTRRQCFPQTAQGEELDKHAQLRGVDRRQATRAVGTVRFYVDQVRETDLEIPAGTVCMTAAGERFATDVEGAVPAGELYGEVPVTAAAAGAAGNVGQGTIVYMALPPVGVTACANPAPLSGGQDEEGDGELRERVLATFRRLANGANNAFYEQTAMSFDGVAAVTVLPRNRGVGTVDIVPAAQGGVPDQELLDALQAHFDRVREIACDVKVLPPTAETVDVSVKLWAREGWEFEAVAAAVRQKLEGWFNGERLGKALPRAQLISLIYGVDGVANCRLAQPEEDLDLDSVTLPVLGQLTVTDGAGGGDGA
ncbi:MAG: baseplate J/gp47 family protein [Clostridiales bacterium]|nr:baseplate J/gp47 family protein [Clostridiales bacterium]